MFYSTKKIVKKLVLLFLSCVCFSKVSIAQSLKDKTPFTWDTETKTLGTLMFLDVPYDLNGTNFITLTIAITKKVDRPAFISFTLPSNVNKDKGIEIVFGNTLTHIDSSNTSPVKTFFNDNNTQTFGSILTNGYSKNGDDIFSEFLRFKYLLLTFYYGDTSKIIIVPLIEFQRQFQKLQ